MNKSNLISKLQGAFGRGDRENNSMKRSKIDIIASSGHELEEEKTEETSKYLI